jgi:putative transcriptional regulator
MSQELRNRLKEARARLGMTQAQFAARIEVPLKTLQGWEGDRMTPRGLALKGINQILDKILAEK